MPLIERIGVVDALSQRKQSDLDGVNHGTAAQAHDKIGTGLSQSSCQRDHGIPRRVLDALIENTDHPIAQLLCKIGNDRCGPVQGTTGDDHDALTRSLRDLLLQRLSRSDTEMNPIKCQKVEYTRLHELSSIYV